ncbi:MAG: DUF4249 family protein [Cryomorphaceae bacterium]|nr:DUF4249 family protein [Cryomorphaceae bacterium]
MVRCLTYCLVFLLLSCKGVNVDDLAETELAVYALIIANEPVKNVRVNYLTTLNGVKTGEPIVDANVFLSAQGVEVELSPDPTSPGSYYDEAGVLDVLPNTTVSIRVEYKTKRATASAAVPDETEIVSVSASTIPVDELSLGQPVFSVLWTQQPGFSHVLTLDEPPGGAVIPFTVPSGLFSAQYRLPVPGQGTTLYDVDFTYYGIHTLSIITIDANYDALFFSAFDALDQRVNNEFDNVEGGAGFFGAATRSIIEIEIIEI